MLFRLGPHPFPTLLLQTLQDQLPADGLSLAARCALQRARQSNAERRKLTTCSWACSACGNDKKVAEFATWQHDEIYTVIFEEVIASGATRRCLECKATFACDICKVTKPKREIPLSAWHNKQSQSQNTRCLDCSRPPCTAANCSTCKVCRDPQCQTEKCTKPIVTLNSNFLPATHSEVLEFVCGRCRQETQCDICQAFKADNQFPPSALQNNRATKTQNIRCLDCSRPPCVAANCRTCKVGRDPRCQTEKCTKPIVTLNSNFLPATHSEVLEFVCGRCRQETQCDICQAFKADNQFPPSALQNNRATKTQNIRCLDCSRPPCAAANCRTCNVCRDPKCRTRNCSKPVSTLNSNFLPATHAEVLEYFCERCRYVKCVVKKSDGSFCSRERRQNA